MSNKYFEGNSLCNGYTWQKNRNNINVHQESPDKINHSKFIQWTIMQR